ncbi:NfeD family protein [Chloroflexota bacterium]
MFQVDPWLIATVVTGVVLIFIFVINRVVKAYRRQPSTGWEELIGKTAVVKAALDPEGIVLFKGERWTAVSEEGRLELGETVLINKVDSLKLYVTKKQ